MPLSSSVFPCNCTIPNREQKWRGRRIGKNSSIIGKVRATNTVFPATVWTISQGSFKQYTSVFAKVIKADSGYYPSASSRSKKIPYLFQVLILCNPFPIFLKSVFPELPWEKNNINRRQKPQLNVLIWKICIIYSVYTAYSIAFCRKSVQTSPHLPLTKR